MAVELLYKQRSVISIFIASPGDVQNERQITHNVVDRINKHIARNLGVWIELRGWEETLPSYSRPQEKINEDLIECDMFIGILWKRWGTPSGKCTSGFEEEFNLALELRKESKLKDVWLFFKDMPKDVYQDPCVQASQVIEFRKSVEAKREVLYQSFDTEATWEKLIYDFIGNYLTRIFSYSNESIESKAETETTIKLKDGLLRAEVSVERVLEGLKLNNFDNLSSIEIARAYLAAQSLYYSKTTINKSQLIDSHDLHYLYNNRENIKLSNFENITLLSTLLADSEETKVGWYWDIVGNDQIESILVSLIEDSGNHSVKVGCLYLLADLNLEKFREVAYTIIKSNDVELTKSVFYLFAINANEVDVEYFLEFIKENSIDDKNIWMNFYKSIGKTNPNEALLNFTNNKSYYRNYDIINLEKTIKEADLKVIQQLLDDQEVEIRYLAFQLIGNKIDEDTLISLTQGKNITLALLSYKELINRGVEVSEAKIGELLKTRTAIERGKNNSFSGYKLRYALRNASLTDEDVWIHTYKQKTSKQLFADSKWGLEGALNYAALIDKHYEEYKKILMNDINHDFLRIENERMKELESVIDYEITQNYIHKYKSFLRGYYMKESLRIFRKYFQGEDLPVIRNLFHRVNNEKFDVFSSDILKVSIKIIGDYGNYSDVDLIKPYLTDVILRDTAINSIASLVNENNTGILLEILKLDDLTLRQDAMRIIIKKQLTIPINIIRDLLYDSNEIVRQSAVLYLIIKSKVEELKEVLLDYVQSQEYSFYYYNVVCWLDRIIYAPELIKNYYLKRLHESIERVRDSLMFY